MGPLDERLIKDVQAQVGQELLPVGPQILFPSARIDILRAQDPVSGAPVVNMIIAAGNGAFTVVVPIPATVTREQAMMGGGLVPATVLIARKLVEPDYRVAKIDASGLDDAPVDGDLEIQAEVFDE